MSDEEYGRYIPATRHAIDGVEKGWYETGKGGVRVFERKISRRGFIKGIAGITAAGIVLPDEEVVRRFWRGWAPRAAAKPHVYTSERVDADWQPTTKIYPWDVVKVDDEIMVWTGTLYLRGQAGTRPAYHTPRSPIEVIGVTMPEMNRLPPPTLAVFGGKRPIVGDYEPQ